MKQNKEGGLQVKTDWYDLFLYQTSNVRTVASWSRPTLQTDSDCLHQTGT